MNACYLFRAEQDRRNINKYDLHKKDGQNQKTDKQPLKKNRDKTLRFNIAGNRVCRRQKTKNYHQIKTQDQAAKDIEKNIGTTGDPHVDLTVIYFTN